MVSESLLFNFQLLLSLKRSYFSQGPLRNVSNNVERFLKVVSHFEPSVPCGHLLRAFMSREEKRFIVGTSSLKKKTHAEMHFLVYSGSKLRNELVGSSIWGRDLWTGQKCVLVCWCFFCISSSETYLRFVDFDIIKSCKRSASCASGRGGEQDSC